MALALFVSHTYVIDAADATPYMVVVSAEKQSGKSRLLEVLRLLVHAPWMTSGATASTVYRKIERDRPTLLLDEIDAIFGSNTDYTEPLRGALNAGNRRNATVTRTVGQGAKLDVAEFSVFCPKVLAGIDTGRLPDTIRDRAVVIHIKRRRPGEGVERLRTREAEAETQPLRTDLASWADDAREQLQDATPPLPDALSDRAGDAWEPLFAIADVAGVSWGATARAAAVALAQAADGGDSRATRLLWIARIALAADLQISTADLLGAINSDEEHPFGAWNNGNGMQAHELARMLRPYGVKPTTIRLGDKTAKGYKGEHLADAFERYLPPSRNKMAGT